MEALQRNGALTAQAAEPMPADNTPAQQDRQPIDPAQQELFNLAVGRSLDALSRDARGLDAALKADPIKGAVAYGTSAVRAVAGGAEKAGKPIPFEILIQVGMQVVKELAAIANEKGYLPDEQIGTYLKEAFQQSIARFAKLDMQEGKINAQQMSRLQGGMAHGAFAPQGQGAPQPTAAPQPGAA